MTGRIKNSILEVLKEDLPILDREGLHPFICDVLKKCNRENNYDLFYTVSLFCMKLFDGNVDDLLNELFDSNFHKWEGLDEWNKLRGEYSRVCDIQWLGERWTASFTTSEPPLVLPDAEYYEQEATVDVDYNKYKNRTDFSFNSDWCCNMTIKDKPFIDSNRYLFRNIDESAWDDLYVAIITDQWNGTYTEDLHYAYDLSNLSDQRTVHGVYIAYTSIRNIVKLMKEDEDINLSLVVVDTALPRNIVEKYGFKIWEG